MGSESHLEVQTDDRFGFNTGRRDVPFPGLSLMEPLPSVLKSE